jgi:hypothetical protein
MRDFWAEALIRPGTAHFFRRLWIGLDDTACTLTCWRGIFDLAPLLLLLVAVGVTLIWRRRGPEYAIMLAGPIFAGFGASMLGRYPIAARLMLYAAPLLAVLVAVGIVAAARSIEARWPRVKTRWPVALFLYPSLVLAAVLTFAPPADWGVRGVEIGPLADVFLRDGGGEPVYIFARAIPAWVFHTTNWADPDTARLAWVARNGGPDGGAFVNGPSRGTRPRGEGRGLVYLRGGRTELFGTPSGSQGRVGTGYTPPHPDPGWAENEVWRMRSAAHPYVWLVMSDFDHLPLDERGALLSAVRAQGGELVSSREAPGAVLYRIRFGSRSPD